MSAAPRKIASRGDRTTPKFRIRFSSALAAVCTPYLRAQQSDEMGLMKSAIRSVRSDTRARFHVAAVDRRREEKKENEKIRPSHVFPFPEAAAGVLLARSSYAPLRKVTRE